MSVCLSVCVSVCVSASIFLEPLDRSARNIVCGSPVAVARSSSGGVALHYVLPVLWMTSRLAVMAATPKGEGGTLRRRSIYVCDQDGVWCLWMLIMAVLYISRGNAIMFYRCTLFFFFFFVSKSNLRGYWADSIHTFTQYPVWVKFNNAPLNICRSLPHRKITKNPPKWAFRTPIATLDGE